VKLEPTPAVAAAAGSSMPFPQALQQLLLAGAGSECDALEWWMHAANLVGSVGFWLCSFFGFFAYPARMFQRWGMAFSCLWGSWAFLLGGLLQLMMTLRGG